MKTNSLHTMTTRNRVSSKYLLASNHPIVQEYIWMATILTSILILVI